MKIREIMYAVKQAAVEFRVSGADVLVSGADRLPSDVRNELEILRRSLEAALFTAINKDTCALYHALVPVEPGVGWRLVKRGVAIAEMVDRDRLPLRIADQQECRGCGWEQPCHGPIAKNSPYQQNKST